MEKQTKVITKRRKFIEVEIPMINQKIELVGDSAEDIEGRTMKLDLTRQLKGKSVEVVVKIKNENGKAVAHPIKIKLMPYFIRRMIRKRISYVEDSFDAPSQESMIRVKPFLITRKRVSRVVRKTLRNKARNWLEDYIAERKDDEIFREILGNKMQRPLSLVLKKTYPLSLCEIRILEIGRPLSEDEIPKIEKKKEPVRKKEKIEEGIDQLKEIEDEKKKRAEEEIKKAQDRASEKEKELEEEIEKEVEEAKENIEDIKQKEKETDKSSGRKVKEGEVKKKGRKKKGE